MKNKTLREEFYKKFKNYQARYANQCIYGGDPYYGENTNYEDSDFTKDVVNLLDQALAQREAEVREEKVTGETSDGYHTFKELYEFRKLYNAALFNEWSKQDKFNVHKSWKHNEGGRCFGGGWFIVMATLPTGQISNHYEKKDWDLFKCEERELADKWDGHTAQDVSKRLLQYLNQNTNEK